MKPAICKNCDYYGLSLGVAWETPGTCGYFGGFVGENDTCSKCTAAAENSRENKD